MTPFLRAQGFLRGGLSASEGVRQQTDDGHTPLHVALEALPIPSPHPSLPPSLPLSIRPPAPSASLLTFFVPEALRTGSPVLQACLALIRLMPPALLDQPTRAGRPADTPALLLAVRTNNFVRDWPRKHYH